MMGLIMDNKLDIENSDANIKAHREEQKPEQLDSEIVIDETGKPKIKSRKWKIKLIINIKLIF